MVNDNDLWYPKVPGTMVENQFSGLDPCDIPGRGMRCDNLEMDLDGSGEKEGLVGLA